MNGFQVGAGSQRACLHGAVPKLRPHLAVPQNVGFELWLSLLMRARTAKNLGPRQSEDAASPPRLPGPRHAAVMQA